MIAIGVEQADAVAAPRARLSEHEVKSLIAVAMTRTECATQHTAQQNMAAFVALRDALIVALSWAFYG